MVTICSLFPDLHIRHNNIALANESGKVIFLLACSYACAPTVQSQFSYACLDALSNSKYTRGQNREKCVV